MGAELQQKIAAEVEYIASSGGVFEVKVDGRLIYSKKELGRFPEEGEVVNLIARK